MTRLLANIAPPAVTIGFVAYAFDLIPGWLLVGVLLGLIALAGLVMVMRHAHSTLDDVRTFEDFARTVEEARFATKFGRPPGGGK